MSRGKPNLIDLKTGRNFTPTLSETLITHNKENKKHRNNKSGNTKKPVTESSTSRLFDESDCLDEKFAALNLYLDGKLSNSSGKFSSEALESIKSSLSSRSRTLKKIFYVSKNYFETQEEKRYPRKLYLETLSNYMRKNRDTNSSTTTWTSRNSSSGEIEERAANEFDRLKQSLSDSQSLEASSNNEELNTQYENINYSSKIKPGSISDIIVPNTSTSISATTSSGQFSKAYATTPDLQSASTSTGQFSEQYQVQTPSSSYTDHFSERSKRKGTKKRSQSTSDRQTISSSNKSGPKGILRTTKSKSTTDHSPDIAGSKETQETSKPIAYVIKFDNFDSAESYSLRDYLDKKCSHVEKHIEDRQLKLHERNKLRAFSQETSKFRGNITFEKRKTLSKSRQSENPSELDKPKRQKLQKNVKFSDIDETINKKSNNRNTKRKNTKKIVPKK